MICSNCEGEAGPDCLVLMRLKPVESGAMDGKNVAVICTDCQRGVLVTKLVIKRERAKDDFQFEQYLAVEVEK